MAPGLSALLTLQPGPRPRPLGVVVAAYIRVWHVSLSRGVWRLLAVPANGVLLQHFLYGTGRAILQRSRTLCKPRGTTGVEHAHPMWLGGLLQRSTHIQQSSCISDWPLYAMPAALDGGVNQPPLPLHWPASCCLSTCLSL